MLGHQVAFSVAPIRKVKKVQYPFSGADCACFRPIFLLLCRLISRFDSQKAISVTKIEHPEVMDEATHKPKMGGLMDPCMGTIDRNFKCQTCGEGMSECPGHFGHIELARPIFHPGVLSFFCFILAFVTMIFFLHRFHRESEEDS